MIDQKSIETIYFNSYVDLLASLCHCSLVFSLVYTDREIFNSIPYTAIPIIAYMIVIPAGFV